MHELYELKDVLMKELEEYGRKGELTGGSLEIVDKLAHTIKNLDKIIEKYEEEEYSSRDPYYGGGMSYHGNGSDWDRSYARGRGRNARRDSMGRYSSTGYSRDMEIVAKLKDLMNEAPDERSRMEIQKLVSKMETM